MLVWAAIYGIALQGILAPLAPSAAQGAGVDPFAIICHGNPQVTGAQDSDVPASHPGAPAQRCDHCVLCNVTPAAAAPAVVSANAPRLSHRDPLLVWALAAPRLSPFIFQKLARGPPQAV